MRNKFMNMIKLVSVSLLFLVSLLLVPLSAAAEIAVIVASGSSISETNASEVQRLYLGKSKALGGVNATPINQAKGNTVDAFNKGALKKSSSQVKAYWSKLIFTGKGTPPIEVGSDAEVIAAVVADTSAVGYVDAAAVTSDVKVLLNF